MKTKNKDIRSIDDLRKRKACLVKEMKKCESHMMNDCIPFSLPFFDSIQRAGDYEKQSPLSGFLKLAVNAKRVMDIVRLGSSIYNDYKRR